jgi:hypothetical protein
MPRVSPSAGIDAVVEWARNGELKPLTDWLASGADPDQKDSDGWTPLLSASVRGQAKTVDLLLFHSLPGGRRANSAIRFEPADALPIYMAGQSGDVETARLLLRAKPEHLFEICSVNGHTVLLQTAFYGLQQHAELATYILEEVGGILGLPTAEAIERDRKRLLVAPNVRGLGALAMARFWKNQRMIDIFQKFVQPNEKESAAALSQLLKELAPPPPKTDEECRAQRLSDAVVEAIQSGFRKVSETSGDAPAIQSQVLDSIKSLVESPGFDVNRLGGPLQQPPLVVVASGDDKNAHVAALRCVMAEYLLSRGADPDRREKHPMGVGAVIRAAVLNHFDLLKIIANHMTPAAFAVAMNLRPAVNGLTALHDSVHTALIGAALDLPNHLRQIGWMVERGARSDIEDYSGKTQEQLAREALADPKLRDRAQAILLALNPQPNRPDRSVRPA